MSQKDYNQAVETKAYRYRSMFIIAALVISLGCSFISKEAFVFNLLLWFVPTVAYHFFLVIAEVFCYYYQRSKK